MLIPLESRGLKGAELDKAGWGCGGGSGGWWEQQIRGEVEKDREGRVYLQSAPHGV